MAKINPYAAPENDPSWKEIGPKKRPFFHGILCGLMVLIWLATIYLMNDPDGREIGGQDAGLFVLLNIALALVSLGTHKSSPSKIVFWLTQLLAWGLSVGVVAMLTAALFFFSGFRAS